MRPELRKMMVLPTPRWTAGILLGAVLVATAGVAAFGPGDAHIAEAVGLTVPGWIAAIVIGVWLPGLEYGQKTMRRTLTRNPNRLELVANKLAVVLLAVTALTVVPALIAAPSFAIAASFHDASVPILDTLRSTAGSLAGNLVFAAAGFSFGLATRSMAGGVSIALAFFFVIESLLTRIPKVGDLMLTSVSSEIFQAIVGEEIAETSYEVHLARALVVTAFWLVAFVGLSSWRFVRTDID